MKASVVINTYNRAASLRRTLEALRYQTFQDFELIVVNGPSSDGTDALIRGLEEGVRGLDCSDLNLSRSRNVGIEAAAGDVVAFIDDDAIPEPRWLEELMEPYQDDAVGGSGGRVLDHTGIRPQYRYSICDRKGTTDFHRDPPFDDCNFRGADPFVYLQGTNASFRREALEQVGGFDEEIEYNYDEAEVCLQVIDAGWKLAPLAGAIVHHKFLASHMRREAGLFTDPYQPMKNRAYFALRNGRGHYTDEEIFDSLHRYVEGVRGWAVDWADGGGFSDEELRHFMSRLEAGFALGVERGLRGERQSRELGPLPAEAFRPYPVLRPERRLGVGFVSLDYPPKRVGGIARYTHDLARGMAAEGHEVHVVTRDDDRPYRLDFEEGVWVHRFPVGERWVPALEGHPLSGNFGHLASVYGAVRRILERAELDVVSGSNWTAEALFCAFDPRFQTVMVCSTPMRTVAETQPLIAAQEHTPWQVELEEAALREIEHLVAVSNANLETLRKVPGARADRAAVIWHGIEDLRDAYPRRRPDGDGIEILFVGRLEPRKGVDTLLEAALDLVRERPELRVRLAGADDGYASGRCYRDWLADRLAGEPHVRARFVFEGEVPDSRLYQLYADADIFCAPSRYESFGLILAEAMMMGRPVVACRAGGMVEVVEDGVCGTLVPPGDAGALQAALRELIDDPELRERYARAGRERYERDFRSEVAVCRAVDFYTRVADGARVPRPSSAEAERSVREGAARILGELAEIPPEEAGEAAEQLLLPSAFPIDYEAGVRNALGKPDREFVTSLYKVILRRSPDTDGLSGHLASLAGGRSRAEVVRDIATSDEARDRCVDPEWLDGIEDRLPAIRQRGARLAWLRRSRPAQAARAFARKALTRVARPLMTELRSVQAELEEQRKKSEEATGQLSRRIDVLVSSMDSMARRIEAGSAELQGRVAELGHRTDALSARLDVLQRKHEAMAMDFRERIAAKTDALSARLDVLQRKHEAMAMDFRERIAAKPEEAELPDPVVVDREAYEHRLGELGSLRLNLGCGEKPLPGYINIDARPLPGVDIVADARCLPFEPGSIAEITSAHLVEHFREHQLATVVLPYWRSLLSPRGLLRTICPNWAVLIEQLNEGRLSLPDFKTVTFGLQDYSGDDHFAMYTPETLMNMLREAGFGSFEVVATDRQNGLSPDMEVLARPAAERRPPTGGRTIARA
jgi:glycogen(starch) synthase